MTSLVEPIENNENLPLAGLRVLDMADGKGEMCGRLLADLGADVVLVEPPKGMQSRSRQPVVAGASLYFATHNANKRSVVLDTENDQGKSEFLQLVDSADILIETFQPGTLEALGLSVASLHARNSQLVVLSMTEFGQTGPFKDFVATNDVQIAMAGVLCRSGLPGMKPLLPPGELAYELAAIQAAYCALLSYWQSQQIGMGDHLDFSFFEGIAKIFDPILGATGSASAGKSAMQATPSRDRPAAGNLYPIFKCKDGYVRMCILNPGQWRAMSGWLGDDHAFKDPKYDAIIVRFKVMGEIVKLIDGLTGTMTKEVLVTEGQRRGVPIAALSTASEAMKNEHFVARKAFVELPITEGLKGSVPDGCIEINNVRSGIRQTAPLLGEHSEQIMREWTAKPKQAVEFQTGSKRRPLEGIRVLDLGIIVAGAELGRILSDQGAEVIKVENKAFPDGARMSNAKDKVSFSIAQGHRGKESLGINLRSEKGVEIFKQLAAKSDIILSNFKPGTLKSLGIDYDEIKKVNPNIIMSDSSALGSTGPLSRSMGYGPLVRALTGLTALWSYPDVPDSFSDGVTIIPDHSAARLSAIGVLALLIQRQKEGVGGLTSMSQAESILMALSTQFLHESLEPGVLKPRGNIGQFNAPHGIFPCLGDDEWCVITVRSDEDWSRLCELIGRPDLARASEFCDAKSRLKNRDAVDDIVTAWTCAHTPEKAMKMCQAVGVPAAKMFRMPEYEHIQHLKDRNFFASIHQTGYEEIWPTENAHVLSLNMPDPEIRPAPLQAEHTRQVIGRVLGWSDKEIQISVDSGDLEEFE